MLTCRRRASRRSVSTESATSAISEARRTDAARVATTISARFATPRGGCERVETVQMIHGSRQLAFVRQPRHGASSRQRRAGEAGSFRQAAAARRRLDGACHDHARAGSTSWRMCMPSLRIQHWF